MGRWQHEALEHRAEQQRAQAAADDARRQQASLAHLAYQSDAADPTGSIRRGYEQQAATQGDRATTEDGKAGSATRSIAQLQQLARVEQQHIDEAGRRAAGGIDGARGAFPRATQFGFDSSGDLVVRSTTERNGIVVRLFLVQLGGGSEAIEEVHRDGSVTLTEADDLSAGVSAALGGTFRIGRKQGSSLGTLELTAGAVSTLKNGRTYEFASQAEADRYKRLRREAVLSRGAVAYSKGSPVGAGGSPAGLRERERIEAALAAYRPASTFSEGGGENAADAKAGFDDTTLGAQGAVSGAVGKKQNADGSYSLYYRTERSANVQLLTAGASAAVSGSTVTEVHYGADGRMHSISITTSSDTSGGVHLDGSTKDLDGLAKRPSAGTNHQEGIGQTTEVRSQLRVADGRDRRIVSDYVNSQGAEPAARQQLLARIDHDGQIDVRNYVARTDGSGVDVKFDNVGVSASQDRTVSQVQSAYTRPPGADRFHRIYP